MSDYETPNTHSLIDRYYAEERERKLRNQALADVTLRLEANDLALLTVLSKRFNKSREDVMKDVMSSALMDLFTAVEPGERKLLARDSDEQTQFIAESIAEENGIAEIELKASYWGQQDKAISRAEKKKAKDEAAKMKVASNVKAAKNVGDDDSAETVSTMKTTPATEQEVEDTSVSQIPEAVIDGTPKAIDSVNDKESDIPAAQDGGAESQKKGATSVFA